MTLKKGMKMFVEAAEKISEELPSQVNKRCYDILNNNINEDELVNDVGEIISQYMLSEVIRKKISPAISIGNAKLFTVVSKMYGLFEKNNISLVDLKKAVFSITPNCNFKIHTVDEEAIFNSKINFNTNINPLDYLIESSLIVSKLDGDNIIVVFTGKGSVSDVCGIGFTHGVPNSNINILPPFTSSQSYIILVPSGTERPYTIYSSNYTPSFRSLRHIEKLALTCTFLQRSIIGSERLKRNKYFMVDPENDDGWHCLGVRDIGDDVFNELRHHINIINAHK